MNKDILKYLICPDCGFKEMALEGYSSDDEGGLDDGRVICPSCSTWYRIEHGILDLLSISLRRTDKYKNFAEKYKLQFANKWPGTGSKGDVEQIQFFKENADNYESHVVNSSYYQALDHIAFSDWVKRSLSSDDCVLELGSGTGRQCMLLAKSGIRTIGMDISEEMLLLAKKKLDVSGLGRHVDLIVADAKNPPVKDGLFDACVFYGALHHLDDPCKAILNASKRVRKAGSFFSLDPHDSPVRFLFDLSMKLYKLYDEKAGTDPLFSEDQMKRWLSMAGMNCVTRLSTYIPPHLCYMLSVKTNIALLNATDLFFSRIFFLRKFAGVIISEGVKERDVV